MAANDDLIASGEVLGGRKKVREKKTLPFYRVLGVGLSVFCQAVEEGRDKRRLQHNEQVYASMPFERSNGCYIFSALYSGTDSSSLLCRSVGVVLEVEEK